LMDRAFVYLPFVDLALVTLLKAVPTA
jgi:hypothetical protein